MDEYNLNQNPLGEEPKEEQPKTEPIPVTVFPVVEESEPAPQEEPAPQAEPPVASFPVFEEPAQQEQPPEEPPAFIPQPPPYQAPPVKRPKPITLGIFLPIVAGSVILSLIIGLASGFLSAMFFSQGQATAAGGTAVIYKTTKLKDENGDAVKQALTIPEVAALVKNSVVEITTEQIVTGSFMQQYVSEGAGSGVIITADGYVVTNHHVIDGATNINVRLADGTAYTAKLVGSDSKSDLAVLKMEATDLTPAPYGKSSELAVGETVVAVGNPLGQLGGTVTQGIISALDREITIDNTTMRLLQTDTAINPGNSGGGMFNTSGQLVGIVNAKSAGEEIEGLGFAIPIDTASKVIEDLISVGYVTGRVDPGFTFVEVNDAMTAMMYRVNELGLYVQSVAANSDAAKAGFLSGDYVVSVEGTKVTTEAEANAIIDEKAVGETVTIVVKRSGKEEALTLTLSEYVPSAGSNGFQNPTQQPQQSQQQQSPSIWDIFGF